MTILTLNVGSSSLKLALYSLQEEVLEEGEIAFKEINSLLKTFPRPTLIAHRIVFGGTKYIRPVLLTKKVVADLKRFIPLSPLHLPPELKLIEQMQKLSIPQVGCFDTAFHSQMPEIHKRYPLPSSLEKWGIKKYGYHGLSYEYICSQIKKEGRIIIAHLGSGSSLAAIHNGKPLDTTMGFTPTSGVMMATRPGDLDPSILTYLIREKGYTVKQLDTLINDKSGLLAFSKKSGDMQTLLKMRKKNSDADLAISLYCLLCRKAIGALAASLGGVDRLIFTGGIGENSPEIRKEIVKNLDFLKFQVKVIPTNENLVLARHAIALYNSAHAA